MRAFVHPFKFMNVVIPESRREHSFLYFLYLFQPPIRSNSRYIRYHDYYYFFALTIHQITTERVIPFPNPNPYCHQRREDGVWRTTTIQALATLSPNMSLRSMDDTIHEVPAHAPPASKVSGVGILAYHQHSP